MRSGASEIIYDFFLHSGSSSNGEIYRKIQCLDTNWDIFRSWKFLIVSQQLNPLSSIMSSSEGNRLHSNCYYKSWLCEKCPLPLEKGLRKEGLGSHGYIHDLNCGVSTSKLFDNKNVQIWATHCNPEAVEKGRKFDRKSKKFINILCPTGIKDYNKSVGGVDLSDMLIALYNTSFKTKRWYLKMLFHYLVLVHTSLC